MTLRRVCTAWIRFEVARWLPLIAFAVLAACPSPNSAGPAMPETLGTASLQLGKAQLLRHGVSAKVVAKIEQSRFRYFRMLGEAFELRTCEAFREYAPALPVTPVHGDPHLEQFVVTATTFGLEDFDRAGLGPAVVDLVRYAAGLHVACSDVVWPCNANAAVDRFLSAYRATLVAPATPSEPAIVQRLRAKTPRSRGTWLRWADTLMVPLAPARDADVRRSWESFRGQMLEIHPEWSATTYNIVRVGSLSLGFGSSLERKVLIRIAGETASPDDDLVVEAREGMAPTDRGCVWRASYGESLILWFRSILGRRMPEIHGFTPLPGSVRQFWLQSWDPGYAELSVRDIASQSDLEELAVDAARQLAGYLWTHYPETLRRYQRHAQLRAFDATRVRVVSLARELAVESNAGWARFRTGAAAPTR